MVAEGDRHYAFVPLWGRDGRGAGSIYNPQKLVLNRQPLGQRGEFRFQMCENLPVSANVSDEDLVSGAVLLFRPSIAPGDEIAIEINGQAIAAENIKYEWQDETGKPPLCSFALTSPPSVYGDNYLGLQLINSAAGAKDDVVLEEVETIVKTGN